MPKAKVQPHIHKWVFPTQQVVERHRKVLDLVTGSYYTVLQPVVINSNVATCSCGSCRTFHNTHLLG